MFWHFFIYYIGGLKKWKWLRPLWTWNWLSFSSTGAESLPRGYPPSQLSMLTKARSQLYEFQCIVISFPIQFEKSGLKFPKQS